MKVLILGGSQFLSREVARQAVERVHEVVCACRGTAEVPEGVRFVHLDREDANAYSVLGNEHFDAAIDVARRPSFVARAVDALAANTGHFTFVSSMSVYADTSTPGQSAATGGLLPPLGADADENAPENYGSNKVSCESLVRGAWGDSALIARAGLVVGPGDPTDRFTYWPARIAMGGEVLAPGRPDDPVQWIDVRDLAAWILQGVETARGGTMNVAAQPTTRLEFLEEIIRGVAPAIGVRLTWAGQQVLESQGIQPWAGEKSLPLWLPLPEYGGFLSHDVRDALDSGLRPRPLRETARDTLDWWAASGAVFDDLKSGLSRADEAAALTAAAR